MPVSVTETTSLLLLFHVICLFVAFSGETLGENPKERPGIKAIELYPSPMFETGTFFNVTFTVQEARFPLAVAVIVALPALFPVTVPPLTEATELLLLLQLIEVPAGIP